MKEFKDAVAQLKRDGKVSCLHCESSLEQHMLAIVNRSGNDHLPPPRNDIEQLLQLMAISLQNVGTGGSSGSVNNLSYAVLNGDEICDYYAINNSGEAVLANGYGCSSFIDCYGCISMQITLMQLTSNSNYGLAFYDENKNFISFVPSLVGTSKASVMQTVSVPALAHYFKATFFNYEQQKEYGNFECSMVFNTNTISNGKRPYQNGYIFFSQRVNQSITKYWETDETIKHGDEYKVTTGVLALPTTYNQTGKKTPLIVYCHGLSHYVYYGAWGNTDAFREQKQHWLDMGFAVMDCNGARDNNRRGQFASGICPQGVNAYKQCIDYVVKNYNVDNEIYIIGGSCGGAVAWNFLNMYGNCVKAAVFISAWADSEFNAWTNGGSKSLFVEYLGFNDTTTYEVDKTIGFDQKYRIITIGDKDYCFMPYNVPIYGLYGGTETSLVNPMKKTFAALRNAGANAQIRGIAGCGHEIVSGANIVVDTEIGNWFLSHSGPVENSTFTPITYYTITYNYVDSSGKTIKTSTTEQVIAGSTKNFANNVTTISGYSFSSVSVSSAVITSDMTVTYTYIENKADVYHTITYKYVDGNNSTIQASTTEQVADGTIKDFTTSIPTIDGYTFSSVDIESSMVINDMTITYTYILDESGDDVVVGNDLTSLFKFDRKQRMCVSNPIWKSSSNFDSCFTDLSAYAGKTIRITIPQYTASNGQSSTGMTMWCTQPEEQASNIHTRVKVWDTSTHGNGKGVLVEVETVVPAEAPYLWTSTYAVGSAAYVGPNDGYTDFSCVIVE